MMAGLNIKTKNPATRRSGEDGGAKYSPVASDGANLNPKKYPRLCGVG